MFRFIVYVLFVVLAGCGETKVTEGRIDNVVRVFWHQGTNYSVLAETDNNTFQMRYPPYFVCGTSDVPKEVSIVSDVPQKDKMWVSWKSKEASLKWNCSFEMTIHIHTPKDIGEGSWTCGKSTCQTSVIE